MIVQSEIIQPELIPSSFIRSDSPSSELSARISNVVANNPFLNTRQIHFSADGNDVVIRGRVETFFKKQMAQEAVRNIEGVESIDNQLKVSWI